MLAAVVLALVIHGAIPDSGFYVTRAFTMPQADMARGGTCRTPGAQPVSYDSLWCRWRLFGVPVVNRWRDDSVWVSRSDTVVVVEPVPTLKLWIMYVYGSVSIPCFGPTVVRRQCPQVYGCARRWLLVPKVAQ